MVMGRLSDVCTPRVRWTSISSVVTPGLTAAATQSKTSLASAQTSFILTICDAVFTSGLVRSQGNILKTGSEVGVA